MQSNKWEGLYCRAVSFDGGGIRGAFQAKLLSHIEKQHSIIGHVELYAGTSTGAIIAASLANGFSSEEIYNLYEKLGEVIFQNRPRGISQYLSRKPAYNADILKECLSEQFDVKGNQKLFGECKVRTIIPTVSLVDYSLKVFDSRNYAHMDYPLVDILMASTAAPTFFKPHRMSFDNSVYIDGGLACSNPAFEVVKLAVKEQIPLDRIKILSIGTGSQATTKLTSNFNSMIKLIWAKNLIDILMRTSTSTAQDNCERLLKDRNLLRIDPEYGIDVSLDDYTTMIELAPNLASSKYDEFHDKMKEWKA